MNVIDKMRDAMTLFQRTMSCGFDELPLGISSRLRFFMSRWTRVEAFHDKEAAPILMAMHGAANEFKAFGFPVEMNDEVPDGEVRFGFYVETVNAERRDEVGKE